MFWLFGLGDPWVKTGLTEKPNFDTSFHFGKNCIFTQIGGMGLGGNDKIHF